MPTWLRVILILVGILAVILAVLVFAVIRTFRAHEGELRASAQTMNEEGTAFGRGKEPAACIDEGLRRVREYHSFTGNIRARLFTDACLKAATPSPQWCAEVPSGIIDTARWAASECVKRGMAGDQGCSQVLAGAGDYCHPRR